MKKLVYIDSYAQAESLGFKPFDSMISTVVDAGKAPEVWIEAMAGSHTFSGKDEGKWRWRGKSLRVFIDEDGYRFHAIDPEALGVLLDALYAKRPKMTELVSRPVRYGARKQGRTIRSRRQPNVSIGIKGMMK